MPRASLSFQPGLPALAAILAGLLALQAALFWWAGRRADLAGLRSRGRAAAEALAANAEDAILTGNRLQLELYAKSASKVPGVASVRVEGPGDAELAQAGGPAGEGPSVLFPIRAEGTGRVIGRVLLGLDPSWRDPAALSWLPGLALLDLLATLLAALAFWVAWAGRESGLRRQALHEARKQSVLEWLEDWDEDGPLHLSVVSGQGKKKRRGN